MKQATLAQSIKLLTLIEQDGTPCEQIQEMLASGLFFDFLHADFSDISLGEFREVLGFKNPYHFPISVDYNLPVRAAIAAGKYSRCGFSLDEPVCAQNRKGRFDEVAVVVDFDEDFTTTQQVLDALNEKKLRPADLYELLAVGKQYRHRLGRRSTMVALGALFDNPYRDREGTVAVCISLIEGRSLNTEFFSEIGERLRDFSIVAIPK